MTERRKRIIIYVLGTLFIGFILLTVLVFLFPQSLLDKELSEEIQEHQYPFLDAVMQIISFPGYMPNSLIMVLIYSAIFFCFKYKKEALYILFTLFSGLISSAIKIAVNRPRPTEEFVRIIEKTKTQSFPSGHVFFYVIFFGFIVLLMYYLKSIPVIVRFFTSLTALFMIFTVPFSRIYLGAHWFTDVLAAFMLGLVCLFILSYFYLRKRNSV